MDISIPRLLYEDEFGVFLLVTVALGGGAAWMTGRAIAATWRPWWQVVLYVLLLAAAVRFIHYALFGATLLSLHYYAVDALICLGIACAAFEATRRRQMATQYAWLGPRGEPAGLAGQARDTAADSADSG